MKADELTPKPRHGYVGWELPESERARLLDLFEPSYPDVIAHHATHKFGVKDTYPLPEQTHGEVIGVADDGERVQALVLMVDGNIYNANNNVYHITWSIDRAKGAKPFMSNQLIAAGGWKRLEHKIPVQLIPAFFDSNKSPA